MDPAEKKALEEEAEKKRVASESVRALRRAELQEKLAQIR